MNIKKISGWAILLGFGFPVFQTQLRPEVTFEGALILYAILVVIVVLLMNAIVWVLE